MTVFRRKFEVETTGSRETGDLRPKLSDDCPEGLNYRVHSYDEVAGTCIVEVWCSNHEILPEKHQKNASDLAKLDSKGYMKKVIPNPNPDKPLGSISISAPVENVGKPDKRISKVDRAQKKITVKGKQLGFLKSRKSKDTAGKEIEEFLLDEG